MADNEFDAVQTSHNTSDVPAVRCRTSALKIKIVCNRLVFFLEMIIFSLRAITVFAISSMF